MVMKQFYSVVLALFIAYYIGRWLFDNETLHGPDSNDIKKDIYHDEDIGCYKLDPVAHICPFHT